jgi:cytochrome P450
MVKDDIETEGQTLKAGNIVMAPTWLGHRQAQERAEPNHPPSEFWPERFITYDEERKRSSFSLSGTTGKLFPFSGGHGMCPGRFFAKQRDDGWDFLHAHDV